MGDVAGQGTRQARLGRKAGDEHAVEATRQAPARAAASPYPKPRPTRSLFTTTIRSYIFPLGKAIRPSE